MIIHQTHTTTELDRYPDIFGFARDNFSFAKNILSFGCSSGEECFTLNKYFPNANIFGVDNNEEVLEQAKKSNIFKSTQFVNSIENIPSVDIIFAMSVFCRWPETDGHDYNNIYPFEHFNDAITQLDLKLNSGGVFIIFNANYYFLDADVSNKYIEVRGAFRPEFVRKFDRFRKFSTIPSSIVFIKQ